MTLLPKPPAGAVALTAFRELPDGRARQYTEAWTPDNPWRGCEWFIRMCGAVGYLRESTPEHAYAVLDAIAENGDILATYDIPHARAFRFIYRKLRLRVAETEGMHKPDQAPLRALSIRQPWLWAICTEHKGPENRTRRTHYRGPVALHAGKVWDAAAVMPVPAAASRLRALTAAVRLATGHVPGSLYLTTGAILAVAELAGCHHAADCGGSDWQDGRRLPFRYCTPWAQPGLWHWELTGVRLLAEPVPCKGALGLWPVPGDVERAVRVQLEESSD
jgi:activating signal cointegrator 1